MCLKSHITTSGQLLSEFYNFMKGAVPLQWHTEAVNANYSNVETQNVDRLLSIMCGVEEL